MKFSFDWTKSKAKIAAAPAASIRPGDGGGKEDEFL